MKKLLFGLVATIMLSVTGNAQRLNVKDFRNIGIEHNRLLEAVYNRILTEKTVNKDLAIETLTKETQKSSFFKDAKDINLGIANIKKSFSTPFEINVDLFKPVSGLISENTKKYLDKLTIILATDYKSNLELKESIYNLEKMINEDMNLKNEDLCSLYSATTMAIYSTEYWVKNIENWNNLNGSSTAKAGPRIRRVAGADVVGAVAGAASAWAANAVPGAGQVAYGGAIVGWAAGCSVFQAGVEILSAYNLW